MPVFARLASVLRNLRRGDRVERQLDEEMRASLDWLVREKQAGGLDPVAAERAARLELGGLEQVKEQVRHVRAGVLIEQLVQDARYGWRALRRQPRLAAVVVGTLALALGGTTAIFGVVEAVLLRALPYRDPDRLVVVSASLAGAPRPFGLSAPDYVGLVDSCATLCRGRGLFDQGVQLSGRDRPERVAGARVSSSLFDLLGVQPWIGRVFTAAEDRGGAPVAILSAGLWRRQFGANTNIIGQTVALDRRPYTIVGVMPARFSFPNRGPALNNSPADVFVPMSFTDDERTAFGSMYNHTVIGRLAPGVTIADAQREATAIMDGSCASSTRRRSNQSSSYEYRRCATRSLVGSAPSC